jgi:hypothetical protein
MSRELQATEELIARQPPEAHAINRSMLAIIAEQKRQIAALKTALAAATAGFDRRKKTLWNCWSR